MPVVKLKMGGDDGTGACPFLADEGCTVYEDRPAACRYYPLGLISVKLKDSEAKEDFNFLVREDHCLGHEEAHSQTVAEFCKDQGVEPYEQINRGWIDILMKLASWRPMGGPMGEVPTPQARQMFFMVSTDVERLRKFVFESSFLQRYDIPAEAAGSGAHQRRGPYLPRPGVDEERAFPRARHRDPARGAAGGDWQGEIGNRRGLGRLPEGGLNVGGASLRGAKPRGNPETANTALVSATPAPGRAVRSRCRSMVAA